MAFFTRDAFPFTPAINMTLVQKSRTTMKKIEKLYVTWNGLVPTLASAVKEWIPPKLKSEISYRNSLLEEIRKAVPEDTRVEKEFRHRGTTIDIWLNWKGLIGSDELAFELKLNLKRKADFDRLVGQIEGLDPRKNKIIIILIGETEKSLLDRLTEKYREQVVNSDPPTMAIINTTPQD